MKLFKRMVVMVLLVGLLFGGVIAYQNFVAEMMKGFLAANANPPATVTAVEAKYLFWQPQIKAIGSLRAIQGVELRAEVSGLVKAVHFQSGQSVKKGDLLLELDSAVEQAQLEGLRAARELAEITLSRDHQQFKINAISQAQLDTARSALKSRKAQEAQQQALLQKREIRAPFNGRLGISLVEVGQLINPGEAVATLQNRERLYVDFSLPQLHLEQIQPGQIIQLKATNDNRNENTKVVQGVIHAIDAKVNRETRNVRVEGVIDNHEAAWTPGMFVHLTVEHGAPQQRLTLPQTAISYNAYGPTLFLVQEGEASGEGDGQRVAQQVFVETGARRGDQVAILSGLNEGDQVVTSGQMKLKNGTPLIIDNTVQPANEAAPEPQER